jgi:hypothetical protein
VTDTLGDAVLEIAQGVKARALLCAPFVKVGVLKPLLETLSPEIEVELFTRWRPEEVAAGVSDIGVLPLLEKREGKVFLCDSLHAKLFLFDSAALVGSANLTAKALGWAQNPNLELLLTVPAATPEVEALECELRRTSIPATEAIAIEVERVAAMLPTSPAASQPATVPSEVKKEWLPLLREPRDLFVAYGGDSNRLSRDSSTAAIADLTWLEVPLKLDRISFEALVGTRLLQAQVVQQVDDLLAESRRFGEIRDLLANTLDLDREEANYAWQTLMRWMLYFLPGRYARSVPSHSEILVRRDGTR